VFSSIVSSASSSMVRLSRVRLYVSVQWSASLEFVLASGIPKFALQFGSDFQGQTRVHVYCVAGLVYSCVYGRVRAIHAVGVSVFLGTGLRGRVGL